jgi:hypothetical protein
MANLRQQSGTTNPAQRGAAGAQDLDMQTCIEECSACANTCLGTLQHCLREGGTHAERKHVTLMLDCAEMCRTSADFMLRGSGLHGMATALCAEICDQCATSCDAVDGDREMHECAQQCRACAAACRSMASSHA